MREKGKSFVKYCMAVVFFIVAALSAGTSVHAALGNISVKNGDSLTVAAYIGESGKIEIDAGNLEISGYEFEVDNDFYFYDSSPVMTVASDGTYQILKSGTALVEVYGYDEWYDEVFYAKIRFQTSFDMTQVTLKKSSVVGYMIPDYDSEGKAGYFGANVTIDINSPTALPDNTTVKIKSSSSKITVSGNITDNKLNLSILSTKERKATLKITIEGKTFSVKLQTKKVAISDTSLLLGKKKSKTLKITGYSGKIQWTSMNKKIAAVSKKGKVTGKGYGSTVILAKIGDNYLGCAVSVTKPELIKVCERGEYIGSHWTYSQAQRTKEGYYDCSALVWKAYSQYTTVNFGTSYPGTTKTESAWCRDNSRLLGGSFKSRMITKMQLRPGDIVFKSEKKADKYNTTYHVEMFTGYRCIRVDHTGKPVIVCRWAARGSGYEYTLYDAYIVARPLPY